jgi:uncharacterized protein
MVRISGERREKARRPVGRSSPVTPVLNPHRDVGRNDPCPCGNGKKFKKCYLGRAQSAA